MFLQLLTVFLLLNLSKCQIGQQGYFESELWQNKKSKYEIYKESETCIDAAPNYPQTSASCGSDVDEILDFLIKFYCTKRLEEEVAIYGNCNSLGYMECALVFGVELHELKCMGFAQDISVSGCPFSYSVPLTAWPKIENYFEKHCKDEEEPPPDEFSPWSIAYFSSAEFEHNETEFYGESAECEINPNIKFHGGFCEGDRPRAWVAQYFCQSECKNRCAAATNIECLSVAGQDKNATNASSVFISCVCHADGCPSTECAKSWENVNQLYVQKCAFMTKKKCQLLDNAVFHNGACYAVEKKWETLDAAAAKCKNHPLHTGTLARAYDEGIVQNAVLDVDNEDAQLWIGLRQIGQHWYWMNDDGMYFGFYQEECKSIMWVDAICPQTGVNQCAVVNNPALLSGIMAVDCDGEYGYVCQLGPSQDPTFKMVENTALDSIISLIRGIMQRPQSPPVTLEMCRESCVNDPLCGSYSFSEDEMIRCRIWAWYPAKNKLVGSLTYNHYIKEWKDPELRLR